MNPRDVLSKVSEYLQRETRATETTLRGALGISEAYLSAALDHLHSTGRVKSLRVMAKPGSALDENGLPVEEDSSQCGGSCSCGSSGDKPGVGTPVNLWIWVGSN